MPGMVEEAENGSESLPIRMSPVTEACAASRVVRAEVGCSCGFDVASDLFRRCRGSRRSRIGLHTRPYRCVANHCFVAPERCAEGSFHIDHSDSFNCQKIF